MFPSLQVFGLATYRSALITDKPTCSTWLSKEEDDSLFLKERNEIALGTYWNHKTNDHAEKYDAKESSHANDEVKLVHLEQMMSLFILDQANHGDSDDCW